MDELLKKLEGLINIIEKNQSNEGADIKKTLEGLGEEIKKMGGLSEEDKTKLAKFEEMENEIKKQAKALDELMKKGTVVAEDDMKKYDSEMNTYLKTGEMSETIKKAALNTSTGSGGALLSENRAKEIIKEIMETSPVYAAARVYTSSNDSLKVRVKIKGANNAHAQAEGAAAGTASGSTYGFLELKAGKITDKQEVTQEMRDDAEYNVMAEVLEDSSENIAENVSELIWNGIGGTANNEFYGIYKNTDVTGAAFEAELTWENAMALPYKMSKKVRAKGEYYVSTEALVQMRTWKDSTGRPLYSEPLTAGEPGRFNGYPVIEDSYMDDVVVGKFPMFFGSMRDFYAILRRKGVYVEPKRDADNDTWAVYTRLREGGKVRQKSHGILLKVKAAGL